MHVTYFIDATKNRNSIIEREARTSTELLRKSCFNEGFITYMFLVFWVTERTHSSNPIDKVENVDEGNQPRINIRWNIGRSSNQN